MADITKEYLALRDQYIESRFARLNPVQRQAVFATEGPLLILAGAGSGKTTVLVNRIANIIRFGSAHGSTELPRPVTEADLNDLRNAVSAGRDLPRETAYLAVRPARPWNVLAITFTNKAAGELKERLRAMLGDTLGGDVNASTFHSACVRMLRRDAERIGFPKSFTIYDSDDQQRVIKQIYKDLMIDDKFLPVKSAIGQISSFKDKLLSAEDVAGEPFANTKAQLVSKIYTAYAGRLKAAGAMDFDDLIFHTVKLLQNDAEAREYYQNRFRYVVVDEYQDTSIAQFHLVRLLAGGTNNVCVVGDDDQSIYKFRGATIENILNFEKVFTGAKTIRLEQNYRSTANILNAANSVIKNNMGRKGKTLWTDHGDGEKVHHYTATNEQDEASHIADVIGEHLREGASLKDHAVLYRMNAQSNPIETYFARAGIPYRIVGGQRFFDRKEVKDINSYLAIIVNPRDDVRLRRIINEPARKIGMTTIEKIGELAASKGVPMMEIIAHVRDYPELQRAAAALERFYEMYRELCDLSVSEPLDQFVGDVIAKSGYEAMLKAMKEEGETRRENLGQLVSSIKTYADQNGEDATLSGFLEEVALISDLDSYDNDADSVTMMTIHSAKGLEFPYVFVVGMEDGIFPGEMAKYNEEDMEEERRLCYVAITRAKKELYLSTSRTRMIFGQTRRNPPSAFLSEIDPGLLDETQSPELTGCGGGFGAGYGSYSTNVPGGRSGYSGASRGYLNSEYNARPRGGFGGGYSSGFASGGHESPNSYGGRHQVQSTGFGSGYGRSRSAGNTAPAGRGHIHAGRCAVRCPSEEGGCRQLRGGGHCGAPRVWPRQGAEGHADCGGLHCRDSV